MPTYKGSLKIFTFSGIGVYVHWAWLIVAYLGIRYRTHIYTSPVFNVLEYLSLFLIVLLHEFGHQLSCRQVGGKTHDIILWPLGGVAFVSPPQRPGAQLWSIAAGPLVNVALIPVLSLFWSISFHLQWYDTHSDVYDLIENVWFINIGLLIFNMLPIYPLDGGQIVRSLLWFLFGRANSLLVASVIGLIGAAGFIAWAAWVFIKGDSWGGSWIGFISIFVAMRSWSGFKQARALAAVAKLPRRAGFACPSCKTAPPIGAFWRCGKCGTTFDMFLTQATCPNCQSQYNAILCLDCGTASSLGAWMTVPPSNN